MMKKNKILITGSSGFLGSHIAFEVFRNGYEITGLVNKREEPQLIKKLNFKKIKTDIRLIEQYEKELQFCDTIIHTAAKFSNLDNIFSINTDATISLFRAAIRNKVRKFIFISTRGTLGINKDTTLSNEESSDYINLKYCDEYTLSKIKAEKKIIALSKDKNIELIILCPTAIIGPNDELPTTIGGLINNIINGKITYYIEGKINLIDVRDLAKVCVNLIDKSPTSIKYGIGNKNIMISELIILIDNILKRKQRYIPLPFWLIYPISILISKIIKHGNISNLLNPHRIWRLKKGFSCFNSYKAKKEVNLSTRSVEETINDIIKL